MMRVSLLAVAAGLMSLYAGSCMAQQHEAQPIATGCRQAWPREALRYELEGAVIVKFDLNSDGRAINPKVIKSSGWTLLDDASVRALQSCTFQFDEPNGRRVGYLQQFVWVLEDDTKNKREDAAFTFNSCTPVGRFVDFAPAQRGDVHGSGVLVRFLLDKEGKPFRLMFEDAIDQQGANEAEQFLQSCKFSPSRFNGKPASGNMYGRMKLRES